MYDLVTLRTLLTRKQLRVRSLECLSAFATLPFLSIARYCKHVIKGVVPALDDKKRVVRKAARKVSNSWSIVKQ